MSSCPSFDNIQLGCVPYLNAAPLIYGCDADICFDHPSRLADMLSDGVLDVALVPSFELLGHSGYKVADKISISSRGEVFSVFLAYRGALKDIKQVSLDISSLTSANLLRCILAEYHHLKPEYFASNECNDASIPRLFIGNSAIQFRRANGSAYKYLDLGAEWQHRTGLPFVYAVWLIRPGILHPEKIAGHLRTLKQDGMLAMEEIVHNSSVADAAFRKRYLREHIRFELGDEEKQGLLKYRELLVKHGLLRDGSCSFNFV